MALESSSKIPSVNSALAWLRLFGHCQRAQRNPEVWQPRHPGSDCSRDRHVEASCFAKLGFEFHNFPFRFQQPDCLPGLPGGPGAFKNRVKSSRVEFIVRPRLGIRF